MFLKKSMTAMVLLMVSVSFLLQAQTPAFPDALGGGKYTTGGRGGNVYYVTNLNDSGQGSLRDAISAPNRMVLFKVSGVINLKSKLTFRSNNITVAGQTAPGAGICVTGYTVNISASNIIIRYMRFRLGDVNKVEDDALNCFKGAYKNILIDHCSMSWSVDETMSFYDVKNVTVQNCIISESLYNSYHTKGAHGYGGIFGGNTSSYFYNLIAHHTSRNPRFNGTRYNDQTYGDSLEFANNVIYNWGGNSIYGGEGGKYNIVNNYFKAGPATSGNRTSSSASNKRNRILQYSSIYMEGSDTIFGGKFFIDGNYVDGFPDVSADNWPKGIQKDNFVGAAELLKTAKMDTPYGISDYVPVSPQDAFNQVVLSAGATLPKRDTIDRRIIRELIEGTATFGGSYSSGVSKPNGIIDKPSDVGGLPEYPSEPAPTDTDGDGIPDTWEQSNGLDPNLKADGAQIGSSGYSHLEEYLNDLILKSTTSVREDRIERSFKLYPSVTSGLCQVESTSDSKLENLTVYDISGRSVIQLLSRDLRNLNRVQLDLSTLERGLYLVSLTTTNNKTQTLKVIKN